MHIAELIKNHRWPDIREAFPLWTGTMTRYTKPEAKLGNQIVYNDPSSKERWVFPVPEASRDEKNAIIVVEHPDYTLGRDGKDIVINPNDMAKVEIVRAFPSEDGGYLTDPKHGLPTGHTAKEFEFGLCCLHVSLFM